MGVTGPEEVQPSPKTDVEASVSLNTFILLRFVSSTGLTSRYLWYNCIKTKHLAGISGRRYAKRKKEIFCFFRTRIQLGTQRPQLGSYNYVDSHIL